MSDPFIGQITMFAGNFAPRNWALCDGQLLAVSQNEALFSLLGTTYGGDGRTTFGLPELRGRIPVHSGAGQGPGLSTRPLGQKGGVETVSLTAAQMPSHGHDMQVSTDAGTGNDPEGRFLATSPNVRVYRPAAPNANLHASSVSNAGGGQAHTNLMPTQCINFIIALVGVFPPRS